MKFEQVEFSVSEHFLNAIINDDRTGLSANDIRDLNIFLWSVNSDYGVGHYSCENDEAVDFKTCHICELKANCVTLTYNYQVK